MTAVTIPAPLWRRLAAAFYDLLILAAAWLVTALATVILRQVTGLAGNNAVLRILLFLVGLGIFGWQWTHSGRTVGMRAWGLLVRREDGAGLRWPVAAVRYAAMLLCWGIFLAPAFLAAFPAKAVGPHRDFAIALSAGLTLLGLSSVFMDARRRGPHDRLAGTEVVQIPRR